MAFEATTNPFEESFWNATEISHDPADEDLVLLRWGEPLEVTRSPPLVPHASNTTQTHRHRMPAFPLRDSSRHRLWLDNSGRICERL